MADDGSQRSASADGSPTEGTPSDLDIARATDLRDVTDVAADLGLASSDVEQYGTGKAKLTREAMARLLDADPTGKLVLVTAMTPTRAGAGKTVTTIGLGEALARLGERSLVAIREPSLGPVFGIKGGAAGGGYAQVLPMDDVNLHFTGDIHAVTAAHDLLAAMLDAHIHHGNALDIDTERVVWPRALDVNDRALREVVTGLGGPANGPPRESGFLITAASELMAILCLADGYADLRERVARVVVAYDRDGGSVTADDLGAAGAVTALLTDAFRPNLVQTVEGTPAFVHGGPFANIATGTSSLVADRVGLALADYVVTEVGFGADLGAEKFVDLVARHGVRPDAAVVVATVRALRRHGRTDHSPDDDEGVPDVAAVRAGLANLDHHVETLRSVGLPVVVAVNRFPDDADAEVQAVLDHCEAAGAPVGVSTVYRDGGAGATDLARAVRDAADRGPDHFTPVYDLDAPLVDKIEAIATTVYGADGVDFADAALDGIERLERQGLGDLPVCISKTPTSLSDDPDRTGVPTDWTLSVREVYPAAGAGFVVALTGDVLTMPGLPAEPSALDVDIDEDGRVTGLDW